MGGYHGIPLDTMGYHGDIRGESAPIDGDLLFGGFQGGWLVVGAGSSSQPPSRPAAAASPNGDASQHPNHPFSK